MPNPQPLYPAASQHQGLIHYANSLAFLEIAGGASWPVLIFDRPFTGTFDFQRAQQTAASLAQHFTEGSQVAFTGILMDQNINGRVTPVLHLI
jgi:hypothetical protein